jgi:hypothetical protein
MQLTTIVGTAAAPVPWLCGAVITEFGAPKDTRVNTSAAGNLW